MSRHPQGHINDTFYTATVNVAVFFSLHHCVARFIRCVKTKTLDVLDYLYILYRVVSLLGWPPVSFDCVADFFLILNLNTGLVSTIVHMIRRVYSTYTVSNYLLVVTQNLYLQLTKM